MTEKWVAVVGYEDAYEVSDTGRVRGIRRVDGQGRDWPSRLLKQKTHRAGHSMVNLWSDGVTKRFFVHRLVLAAFAGPCPDGMQGCHSDGDPSNNRLANLRWDTARGNMQDALRHGTNKEVRNTHCPRGHLLQEPNLAASALKRGARNCLACQRGRSAVQRYGGDLKSVSDQKYLELTGVPA